MKKIDEILSDDRVTRMIATSEDGAMFDVRLNYCSFNVIASFGGGWDHVSINPINGAKTPTWDIMCELKDLCFSDDETIIEYHPSKENYVNVAEHCLHLRKPQNDELPVPPKAFV